LARIEIVNASRAHVGRIARRMRPIDRLECEAKGRSPAHALRYSLVSSTFALSVLIAGGGRRPALVPRLR
jgi:hypothetical protein